MNQAEYDEQDFFEIIDHGVEHRNNFPGCGVANTRWMQVVTGIGESAMDAYNDAISLIDQMEDNGYILELLPAEPEFLSDEVTVPMHEDDDELVQDAGMWHRVSIRW